MEADEALPGYSFGSVGWHGDDGKVFRDGILIMTLPKFSTGDTIAWAYTQKMVFFWLNHCLLLVTHVPDRAYNAVVAMRGPLTTIKVVKEGNEAPKLAKKLIGSNQITLKQRQSNSPPSGHAFP